MMNDIYQRIRQIIREFAGSRDNFCQDTGITSLYLRQIFKRQRPITYEFLLKICTVYSTLNVQWLILGTGAMKLHSDLDEDEIDIAIKLTENQRIKLRIDRKEEFFYREVGKLVREEVSCYQQKYRITEERALQVIAFCLACKLVVPKKTIQAFGLLRTTTDCYAGKVRLVNMQAAVTYVLAYRYKQEQDATVNQLN